MDRTERFYRLDQLLHEHGVVSRPTLRAELGVSLATFKRDLEYMRERFNAPIEWDRDARGYRFGKPAAGPSYALPGLWFNAGEVHALLMMQQLLADLQPGLLDQHIAPLRARLRAILGGANHAPEEIERRFKLAHAGKRAAPGAYFELIATALLERRRLHIRHYHRERDEHTERDVSPQRLVLYRDAWYLDAWCHWREGLRSFALDAIASAHPLPDRARNVAAAELEAHFAQGYGIFSGRAKHWAKLRFAPARARWVAAEQWHPDQRARHEADGHYLLEVPYADPRELLMDILRHGSAVEVLAPARLRRAVAAELRAALGTYERTRTETGSP